MKVRALLVSLLISLFLVNVTWAQSLELTLDPSDSSATYIRFTLAPSFDVSPCSYRVMSSPKASTLDPLHPRGISIATFERSGDEVYLLGGPLAPIKKIPRIRSNSARVFIRAYLYCEEGIVTSDIQSIRVKRKRGRNGVSQVKRWLRRELKHHMDYDEERYGSVLPELT